MRITIELESCSIVVQIFVPPPKICPEWSYALLIPRLTGDVIKMTIPELIKALELAAQRP